LTLAEQDRNDFFWDRTLWEDALSAHESGVKQLLIAEPFPGIFIGHTPTTKSGYNVPKNLYNVFNVDTGVSRGDKLTIMDIETKEYWQSDPARMLYS
jgi:serine/threonine protein phosphatase 1